MEAVSPTDQLKILILNRRERVFQALENYYERIYSGSTAPSHYVRSRIKTFFLGIQAMLFRTLEEHRFNQLRKDVLNEDVNKVIGAFQTIEVLLDEKGLTKVDIRRKVDTTDMEAENEIHGLD